MDITMDQVVMKQWAILMATLAILTTKHHNLIEDHLSNRTTTRGHRLLVHREISILHLRMDKDSSSILRNSTHNNREAEVSHQVQEDEDNLLHICIKMATCLRWLNTDRMAQCSPKVVCHHRMASRCHALDLECKMTDRGVLGVSRAGGRLQEVTDHRTCMDTMSQDHMVGNR